MNAPTINTRRRTSEIGPSQCFERSKGVNETDNFIFAGGCWIHVRCINIPTEALNALEIDSVFCFCEPCSNTMNKLIKMKNTLDAKLPAEMDVGFFERKPAVSKIQVLFSSLKVSPECNS